MRQEGAYILLYCFLLLDMLEDVFGLFLATNPLR